MLGAIQDNIKKSGDLNKDTTAQEVDRLQMAAAPSGVQGPPLPDQTPQEKESQDSMPQAMVGAVAPGGAAYPNIAGAITSEAAPYVAQFAKMAQTPGDLGGAQTLVKQVADAGYNTYHPLAQKAQAILNRAMMYARGQ